MPFRIHWHSRPIQFQSHTIQKTKPESGRISFWSGVVAFPSVQMKTKKKTINKIEFCKILFCIFAPSSSSIFRCDAVFSFYDEWRWRRSTRFGGGRWRNSWLILPFCTHHLIGSGLRWWLRWRAVAVFCFLSGFNWTAHSEWRDAYLYSMLVE